MNMIDRALHDLKREFPAIDGTAKGLVYACFFLANHFSRTGGRLLEQFGLSWGEYLVISTLRRSGARVGVSPSTLCDSTGLSTGGVSNLLRRLEKARLVKRAPSAHDGRRVVVELTARGRALAEHALRRISLDQARQLAALPRAERARLYRMLRQLVAQFDRAPATMRLNGP